MSHLFEDLKGTKEGLDPVTDRKVGEQLEAWYRKTHPAGGAKEAGHADTQDLSELKPPAAVERPAGK